MAKQLATRRNNAPIDMTYGFPGDIPKVVGHGMAGQQKLLQFFAYYATGLNAREAARKAGFGEKWAKQTSYTYLKEHPDYVKWLQAHHAQTQVKQLSIEQSDVVAEIARIGLANEDDYLVRFEDKDKKPTARRKHVHELTREQLTAVVVFTTATNTLDWKWRDRDGKLFELGKHLGMFNEKIILEHRHRHLHMAFDLSKVPLNELEALEGQFEVLLGERAATK